jgi:D-glycero-D-manno-heptose 1,7-bisphosphate phosphatase
LTIFLDRDGVINIEKNYLYKVEDFEFCNNVIESCKEFNKLGYQIIIVTNQSGIGRKYYTDEDFQNLTKYMLNEFKKNSIDILDVFYCPHTPGDNCNCRKPKIGMFEQAIKKYTIDLENSIMIGDKNSDMVFAKNSGIKKKILVKTGHKIDNIENADYICEDLKDVVYKIKEEIKNA